MKISKIGEETNFSWILTVRLRYPSSIYKVFIRLFARNYANRIFAYLPKFIERTSVSSRFHLNSHILDLDFTDGYRVPTKFPDYTHN